MVQVAVAEAVAGTEAKIAQLMKSQTQLMVMMANMSNTHVAILPPSIVSVYSPPPAYMAPAYGPPAYLPPPVNYNVPLLEPSRTGTYVEYPYLEYPLSNRVL